MFTSQGGPESVPVLAELFGPGSEELSEEREVPALDFTHAVLSMQLTIHDAKFLNNLQTNTEII